MLSLEQLPAKEKKKRLEDFEAKEKEELQALIEKRKKSATKKKNKEKETKKDEYSGKKILSDFQEKLSDFRPLVRSSVYCMTLFS